jgi:hypothetical protein
LFAIGKKRAPFSERDQHMPGACLNQFNCSLFDIGQGFKPASRRGFKFRKIGLYIMCALFDTKQKASPAASSITGAGLFFINAA